MTFIWNFWKKKRKASDPKQKNMNLDTTKSTEELAEDFATLEFQWIKGENAGGIEFFKEFVEEGNLNFVVFESGNRINKELISEFMESFPRAPIDLGGLPSDIKQQATPRRIQQGTSEVNSIGYNKPQQFGSQLDPNSPIYGLLSKQKPNMVDVNISIKINLPPKELYGVLTSSFEGAEKDIVDYVISSLDIEDIKKSLSDSILNTYYQSKQNKNNNGEQG